MKNLSKRILSVFLTLAMLLPLVCVYPFALSASDMADYSEEHWAAEALSWAVEYDLIKGYEDGTIRPDAYLTRAEMATVINRAFGATILADVSKFTDIDINDWFYEEVGKAVNMGTFEGDEQNRFLPNDYIRREEAFAVIARALVLAGADAKALEKFGDYEDVSGWAEKLLADLTGREYINGSPVEGQEKNNLYPRNNITRAEFAQLLHNIFLEIVNVTPVKGTTYEGNILVNYNKGNLVIQDVTVEGDLVIADGVALNSVTMKNVTITGRLVIRGGKAIKLTNVTADGGVVVCNNNTTVNFDNYKSESVFKGIILKTAATFKQPISTGGGSIVVGPTVTTAAYTVKYYTENLDGSYKSAATLNYNGTIGAFIDGASDDYKYDEKEFVGFTYDSANAENVTSGTVASDGSLVLKFYYKRNTYAVTFDYNGGKDANDNTSFVDNIKYNATNDYITYPTVTKNGYTFDGWWTALDSTGVRVDNDTDFVFGNAATTYYAKWLPNDSVYTVKIMLQNVADDNYVELTSFDVDDVKVDDDISLDEAKLDALYTEYSVAFDKTGFVFDKVEPQAGTIPADGTLVFVAYYNRIKTIVTFDYNGGKDAGENTSSSVELKYGAALVTPIGITLAGYAPAGWYNKADDSPAPAVYEEVTDTTYYLDWDEADTTYTLKVYTMDIDGIYDEVITNNIPAVTGTTVSVPSATPEGCYINAGLSTLSDTVKGDGTTVLVVYYDRYKYDVVFMWQGDPLVEESVYHGATLSEDKFEWVHDLGYDAYYLGNNYAHKDSEGIKGVRNRSWVEILGADTYSEDFTPETVVTKDYTLYPMWNRLTLDVNWENSGLDFEISGSKFQTLEIVYNDETRAIDSTKDFVFLKQTSILEVVDKVDDKAIGKLDIILDSNRNIRHFELELNTVKVIGEDNLKEEIGEALNVAVSDPDHQIIVDVVDELLATGTVVIDDENFEVMKEFRNQVVLLEFEKDIKSHIPEIYTKLMSEESIIESYNHAKQQILDNIDEALDHHTAGSTDKVDLTAITDVVIKTDLVGDLLVPKYNVAKNKFISKYESKVGAMDYEMERVMELLSPDALLNYNDAHVSYDDGLSGYSLKTNAEYYEIIKELTVLGDEVGKTLKEKADEKGVEEVADAFAEFVTGYMTTINDYLDKYIDEVVEKGYDALGKNSISIVEKYKDRRLTDADIDKMETALKKVINGYDTTTDAAFDLAVKAANKGMSKDKIEELVDKYTQNIVISDDKLGATAKNVKVTVTRDVVVID